jgi:hypothetical protein
MAGILWAGFFHRVVGGISSKFSGRLYAAAALPVPAIGAIRLRPSLKRS